MPKLIKNREVIDNPWSTLAVDTDVSEIKDFTLVPLSLFLAHTDELLSRNNIGVWLESDEGPEPLAPYLQQIDVIAINFPKFVDGRGYSYARILRDRYNFTGEVRAIGDVMHDQLYYLQRCGFDAFAMRDDKDASAALSGLNDFTVRYQPAADEPRPLYRRRA